MLVQFHYSEYVLCVFFSYASSLVSSLRQFHLSMCDYPWLAVSQTTYMYPDLGISVVFLFSIFQGEDIMPSP